MKLIGIGFGSMLAAHRILAIVDPESAPIKRVVQEARDRGMFADGAVDAARFVVGKAPGHYTMTDLMGE